MYCQEARSMMGQRVVQVNTFTGLTEIFHNHQTLFSPSSHCRVHPHKTPKKGEGFCRMEQNVDAGAGTRAGIGKGNSTCLSLIKKSISTEAQELNKIQHEFPETHQNMSFRVETGT